MRKLFSRQLVEARHEMLSIFEAVDLTLHDAIDAFVKNDKKLASKAKKETLRIDARSANLEAVCYNLIATQSPVASDFRLLQTIIYINFNLSRMSDHVRSIARGAKSKAKAKVEIPQELVDLVQKEADLVYKVLGATASALVSSDLGIARTLVSLDEPVREAYEEFFREYNHVISEKGAEEEAFDDLRRTIMVSRYLERISSVSVAIGSRLSFLLTGQRWNASDIADTDEEELESLRVPSGEGVVLEPAVDARYVSSLPVDEIDPSLAELIRKSGDEVDADLDEDETDE